MRGVPEEWEKRGYSGIFVKEWPIARKDIAWFREHYGMSAYFPSTATRQPWLVAEVEELVIGARVWLVRRDIDAVFE